MGVKYRIMGTSVPKKDKEVYFKLEQWGYNGVGIVACDASGKKLSCGNIIGFNGKGAMIRPMSVNDTIGLQLDGSRQLALP